MAELEEDEIELVIGVIDSRINIHVTRKRTPDLVRNPAAIASWPTLTFLKSSELARKPLLILRLRALFILNPLVSALELDNVGSQVEH
jgi:hypothetical protein